VEGDTVEKSGDEFPVVSEIFPMEIHELAISIFDRATA